MSGRSSNKAEERSSDAWSAWKTQESYEIGTGWARCNVAKLYAARVSVGWTTHPNPKVPIAQLAEDQSERGRISFLIKLFFLLFNSIFNSNKIMNQNVFLF